MFADQTFLDKAENFIGHEFNFYPGYLAKYISKNGGVKKIKVDLTIRDYLLDLKVSMFI